MWMLFLVLGLAQAQDPSRVCPAAPVEATVRAAEAVEDAFYGLDDHAFGLARARLEGLLPCVDRSLSAEESARVHRAKALRAFVADELDASRRSYAAVLHLAPDWLPSSEDVPGNHPLWRLFESSADLAESTREVKIHTPPDGPWWVDGRAYTPKDVSEPGEDGVAGFPADRAFLLQIAREDGQLRYSGYHLSTVDIPVHLLGVLPTPDELRRRRRKAGRIGGSIAAGLLLAGAGTSLALGLEQRADIARGRIPLSQVEQAQVRGNLLGGLAAGMGAGAAVAVTLGFAVPW